MINKYISFKIFLLCVIFISVNTITFAQSLQCSLYGEYSAENPKCLSLEDFNGKTITMPININSFNEEGITLCPLSVEQYSLPPAVIFIVDQSMSMDPDCTTCDDDGWIPGDPHEIRIQMIRDAMQYIYDNGGGYVSFLEFAEDLMDTSIAITKLTSENVSQLTATDGPLQLKYEAKTNYEIALLEAQQFIDDFHAADKTADISIIFISDGQPTTGEESASDLIKLVDVPIHGVFLNMDGDAGSVLEDISLDTKGTYSQVDPNDADATQKVMSDLISNIVSNRGATELEFVVNGIVYDGAVSVLDDGYTQFHPSSIIPLNEGENTISLSAVYTDAESNAQRNIESSFLLNLVDEVVTTDTWVSEDYFSADCYVVNNIDINGLINPNIPNIVVKKSLYPILSPSSANTLDISFNASVYDSDSTQIQIVSSSGVSEKYTLLRSKTLDGKILYEARIPFENAMYDTLSFQWINPENPRDSLIASVLVYQDPKIKFAKDTLLLNAIDIQLSEDAQTASIIEADLFWLDSSMIKTLSFEYDNKIIDAGRNVYMHSSDGSEYLSNQGQDMIVVKYIDPIFKEEYLDTAKVIFAFPVVPNGSIFDVDGNGSADKLELNFTEELAENQTIEKVTLIWGSNGEDTVYIDLDVDQFEYELYSLPIGHTSGPLVQGNGLLLVEGVLDGIKYIEEVAITDKVSPILLKFWIDPESNDVYYMETSEAIAETTNDNLFLYKSNGETIESDLNVSEFEKMGENIYSVVISRSEYGQLFNGDSIRFQLEQAGGVRDSLRNGAHANNPYVMVEGGRTPNSFVDLDIGNPLISFKPTEVDYEFLGPISKDTVIWGVNNGNITTLLDDPSKEIPKSFAQSSIEIKTSISMLQLMGQDSAGNLLDDSFMDGAELWKKTISMKIWLFDIVGQFIAYKNIDIEFDNTSLLDNDGKLNLRLYWTSDPKIGLVDDNGRAVGTGPLIIKVQTKFKNVAQKSVNIYDAVGNLSNASIEEGDVIVKRESMLSKIGYRRYK